MSNARKDTANENWLFAPNSDSTVNLADDARLALLAVCVATQQRNAGFGLYIDIRQTECPECGASGFNTGMGVWQHTCGAELHTDGEIAEPCSTIAKMCSGSGHAGGSDEA